MDTVQYVKLICTAAGKMIVMRYSSAGCASGDMVQYEDKRWSSGICTEMDERETIWECINENKSALHRFAYDTEDRWDPNKMPNAAISKQEAMYW